MTNGRGGHQHFNASDEPARYLVLRYGNMLFGQRGQAREQAQDRSSQGAGLGQIEYPDEDPRIRALFEEEWRQAGRGLRDALAGLSQPRPLRWRRVCWGTSE